MRLGWATTMLIGSMAGGLLTGCQSQSAEADATETPTKVPITTSDPRAREAFVTGRGLVETLRFQEARTHFEEAIAVDPDFALAHLALAQVQPSASGFFHFLGRAVELGSSERVSAGERLMILASEAGANGDTGRQRQLLSLLASSYPKDERAHTLLGNLLFGQQLYAESIESYETAVTLDPDFSPPYNQLGYAYRFLGRYREAEKTFWKYISLLPDEPNPYDSYAELMLEMGRHDESILSYRKALKINPGFIASSLGLATNLVLMQQFEEARAELDDLLARAADDGQARTALFARALTFIHEGDAAGARQELERQLALAKTGKDVPAMAGDLANLGLLALESGEVDRAASLFDQAHDLMEESGLTPEVVANARRGYLANQCRVAVARGDLDRARSLLADFAAAVEGTDNRFQARLTHELGGMIALAAGDWDGALSELAQANQRNALNLYRSGLAAASSGDEERAGEAFRQALSLNPVTDLNHAFAVWRARADDRLAFGGRYLAGGADQAS